MKRVKIRGYDIERIIDKVYELDKEIKDAKLTMSDSNVLSVAMGKLMRDVVRLKTVSRVDKENNYENMEEYYKNRIRQQYNELQKGCEIVRELFDIAKDEDEKSLLMYLE